MDEQICIHLPKSTVDVRVHFGCWMLCGFGHMDTNICNYNVIQSTFTASFCIWRGSKWAASCQRVGGNLFSHHNNGINRWLIGQRNRKWGDDLWEAHGAQRFGDFHWTRHWPSMCVSHSLIVIIHPVIGKILSGHPFPIRKYRIAGCANLTV